jgi:hypothetical protein
LGGVIVAYLKGLSLQSCEEGEKNTERLGPFSQNTASFVHNSAEETKPHERKPNEM